MTDSGATNSSLTDPRLTNQPGLVGFKVIGGGRQGADWRTLDDAWSLAGELGVFDAGWMSDHLANASVAHGGGSLEAFTTLAALSTRVLGMWLGIAVAANTFRHPHCSPKKPPSLTT